jgi:hypothetical protein
VDLHIHSPIRLRGVVLNSLSTGTTLPCPFLQSWFNHHAEVTYRVNDGNKDYMQSSDGLTAQRHGHK